MHATINDVLNRWAAGQTGSQIRKALNLSKNRVSAIVVKARAARDFRAIHHHQPDGEIIGRYRHRPPRTAHFGEAHR